MVAAEPTALVTGGARGIGAGVAIRVEDFVASRVRDSALGRPSELADIAANGVVPGLGPVGERDRAILQRGLRDRVGLTSRGPRRRNREQL